ncbi:MAG: hypothetical protein F4Y82_00580 [Cenarchaeum sp. SB0665_bin_23]|nr:hypothetical protein [Cenarchaeum sp. SB0667_bin_13]MXY60600.1 hypothetical protein [Cenarchaeum sp. SB0665_bin_23]MXZ93832.1 hypothetical protein [Cenarchaeum sp. SB0666_bin_15]MYB46770.1 hypothetical protein [Cenarchaeum sp. SB0662_bin_33]MYC79943.1 hypothetical protein [Cenarchaeum sp. SB0661_bin_35]MYD58485.1 hypothetical protein [Cenarchaeum sp. SB0678_bin_8]MYG33246.1 hypothetical protein [Cenarchaeum sp. SB0677_bin_16]MYI52020.1 hypothetical protein [Cenarchaeum sp. SB0673_bin_9]M
MVEEKDLTSHIMEENAFRIMNKIDMQIPLYVKMQSDIYREYRYLVEDFFEVGKALEGTKPDTLPQDQLSKDVIKYNIRACSNAVLTGLEMYSEYFKWYLDVRLTQMKSLDQLINNYMAMSGMPIKKTMSHTPKDETARTKTKRRGRTQRSQAKSA